MDMKKLVKCAEDLKEKADLLISLANGEEDTSEEYADDTEEESPEDDTEEEEDDSSSDRAPSGKNLAVLIALKKKMGKT